MAPDLLTSRDLAVALGIGLLIGVERGWTARGEPAGSRVAGLRTFAIVGLVGGLAGIANGRDMAWPAAILLTATAAALVAGYCVDMRKDDKVSATTTIVGIATLALGLLATSGLPVLAAACAGVMLLLLSLRNELHAWVGGLTAVEVKAVARFAIISAVIWPLLPDARYGPYDAWNPRELWTVVVIVCGLSFAGYAAARRLGTRRGTLALAASGAVVSSTAVTLSLARALDGNPATDAARVAGISMANAIMVGRALLLAALLAPSALPSFAVTVLPMSAVSAGLAVAALQGESRRNGDQVRLGNPIDLVPALGFAALVAALALVSRWAAERFGDEGLATVVAVSGAFDVDAAIVTLGGLPDGAIAPSLAGVILAIPVMLNTILKAMIAYAAAKMTGGWKAAVALLASFVAGAAALGALFLWGRV
jgi:uncharacterized membrane protein (DUF4010 family)